MLNWFQNKITQELTYCKTNQLESNEYFFYAYKKSSQFTDTTLIQGKGVWLYEYIYISIFFICSNNTGLYVASETFAFASDFSKWRLEIIKRLSFGDCVFFHRQSSKAHYWVKNVFSTFFFFLIKRAKSNYLNNKRFNRIENRTIYSFLILFFLMKAV